MKNNFVYKQTIKNEDNVLMPEEDFFEEAKNNINFLIHTKERINMELHYIEYAIKSRCDKNLSSGKCNKDDCERNCKLKQLLFWI